MAKREKWIDPNLSDVSSLAGSSSAHLRDLGRLPYPMVRRAGEAGFTRIGWEDAGRHLCAGWTFPTPQVLLTSGSGELRGRVLRTPVAPGNLQVHWPEGEVLIDRARRSPQAGMPDYNAVVTVARAPD